MTNQDKPLPDRISAWLEEQGYPLEMRVAATFRKVGLSVVQSTYYRDAETNKARELDVLAGRQGEWADYFLLTVQFAVSCKLADRHPWLVFTGEDGTSDLRTRSRLLVPSPGADWVIRDLWQHKGYHKLGLLQLRGGLGYGVTEAFTSGTDAPYAATMSAVKHADFSAEALSYLEPPDEPDGHVALYAVITVPIVVISGRLFEVRLADTNELEVSEVERSIVRLGYPLENVEQDHTEVLVATEAALPGLAEEAAHFAEYISDQTALLASCYERTIKRGGIKRTAPRIW